MIGENRASVIKSWTDRAAELHGREMDLKKNVDLVVVAIVPRNGAFAWQI